MIAKGRSSPDPESWNHRIDGRHRRLLRGIWKLERRMNANFASSAGRGELAGIVLALTPGPFGATSLKLRGIWLGLWGPAEAGAPS